MSSHTKSEGSFVGLSRLRQMPEPRYEDAHTASEAAKDLSIENKSPFSWLKTAPENTSNVFNETSAKLPQLEETKSPITSKPKSEIPFSLQSLKQVFIEEPAAKQNEILTPDVSFETIEAVNKAKTEKLPEEKTIAGNTEDSFTEDMTTNTGLSPISSQELYILQHKLYEAMLYLSGLLANEKASMDEIQPRLDALKTMVPLFQELQGASKQ